jgi:ethylbenzene dioxygenase beta subunit
LTDVERPGRSDLLVEVEQFLYHEARLLDERRFEEWLALLTDDIHYVMPIRPARQIGRQRSSDAAGGLSYLEEDLFSLKQRVERLASGMAWAEEPPSRTARLVSNVQVSESGEALDVHSVVLLYRQRGDFDVEHLCGHRGDVLRRVDGSLRIARRTVTLAANGLPGRNLGVFL